MPANNSNNKVFKIIKQPTLRQQANYPKETQQTDLTFSHNLIFALFSSVAVQREQRKNQEQGNIYKDFSVSAQDLTHKSL